MSRSSSSVVTSSCSSFRLFHSSTTYSSFMFMLACFGRRILLKNCVVHSFSYLLSAIVLVRCWSYYIIVASSWRFCFYFLCAFLPSSVMVDPSCFVCFVINCSSRYRNFAYLGDLSFSLLYCFRFVYLY